LKLVTALTLGSFALGCAGPADEHEPCAWLGSELGAAGDVIVPLSRDSTVALANAGRTPAAIGVRQGDVVMGAEEGQIEALKVVVSGFTLGEISVRDHGLLVEGPLLLEDLSGASRVSACASFDGEQQQATRVELGLGHAQIDDAAQTLSLTLTYEAEFEFDDPPPIADLFVGGSRVRLTGELSAAGKQPWIER
jgi:hypothetical protein